MNEPVVTKQLSTSRDASYNGHSVCIRLLSLNGDSTRIVVLTPDEAIKLAAFINESLVVPIIGAAIAKEKESNE